MGHVCEFEANGRVYRAGASTYVVMCLDGSSDEYIDAAMARGMVPNLARFAAAGQRYRARAAMPTFTNPNNASIVTGVPPAVHGIGGNFFLDRETGKETMMNSGEYLRAPTILSRARRAGRRVAVVTAKDKLRTILSHGLEVGEGAISVSSERVHEATLATAGIEDPVACAGRREAPDIYSADASTFVLALGAALVRRGQADLFYLSTTDFMQHKFAPDELPVLQFYRDLDVAIGELDRLGAVIGITADHGMNSKLDARGRANVVYLLPLLREIDPGVRVILPITDPHTIHHASLGSFAVVHVSAPERIAAARDRLLRTPGVVEVLDHARACELLQLPPDRTGDLVVSSARDVVLGTCSEDHDLSRMGGVLRSHGGRYEEMVPLIVSRPLSPEYDRRAKGDPRNFEVFDYTINGCGR